ncbi:MAG: helix-turn-helix domain-containing protein [Brevundimonas sp.]
MREGISLMIDAVQVRMARAALKMSVEKLARASGVADSTILRFETGRGAILATNLGRIQRVLEEAGIVFVPADEVLGSGVRLGPTRPLGSQSLD